MSNVHDRLVFLGIHGHALALDRRTGREAWRTPLKGDFVNLVLLGDDLLAATQGEIFCLDPATGRVRWHNPLKGMRFGIATIAAQAARIAPIAPAAEQQRRTEADSSG